MSATATGSVSVLHLEDEPRDARLIQGQLEAEGLECAIVRVDHEAEFRAAVARGGFDIILADHSLPDFDGIDALLIAKQVCPHVPFICVSGSLGEELAIESLKSGATDYVLKHRLSRLAPAVRRALQESGERAKRRQAESEVVALEDQLRHSQKLEAVGQLAGGIAHDFNNLLTVINGYCERLLATAGDADPMRDDLELIHKAGQRAAGLTRQLLAFSRRQVLQPKVIELNGIVIDIERILQRVIGEQVTVVTCLDPALGATQADPGQIEQVIMNLAINARDAMPDGGVLTIETANVTIDALATPRVQLRPGRYVTLAVRDTGTGMDAATASRIFEPFFTTKEAGKGTGLGLSTVYGILMQSGGDVSVETTVGQGTTMRVYLPAIEGVTAKPPAPAAGGPLPSGSETLLLVEDEAFVRELVREFLQSSGYTVIEASSAEEALEIVGNPETPPIDLLVTDVVLPGLNGARLAEQLKAKMPRLEALYISGYPGDSMFRGELFDPGPAFLAKPFTRHVLMRKVREILNARPPVAARVLVVDPDEAIRRLLVGILTSSGYEVIERPALTAADLRRHVNVALIDAALADQAGIATVGALRDSHPGVAIVLMAGAFSDRLLRKAAGVGIHTTLQKPLDESGVLGAVALALSNRP
jgi:two-component system cell cycle sensor histidine kinase/response regulator CckA